MSVDASVSTDSDGDALGFRWTVYAEAGTYRGRVRLESHESAVASFIAPEVGTPATIHVILAVTDAGPPALTRFRRVIVEIRLPR